MPEVEIIDITSQLFGVTEAKAQLEWMEHALDDMHGVLEGIVGDIHRQTLAQFVSEGAFLGDPWEALDPSTVKDKTMAGDLFPDWPLVASGEMMDSATSNEGDFSVSDVMEHEALLTLDWERDGWNIPALQQLGVPREWVHRRAYVTSTGKHVKATAYWWELPSRPFWEATDHLEDEGADRIVAWVMFDPFG